MYTWCPGKGGQLAMFMGIKGATLISSHVWQQYACSMQSVEQANAHQQVAHSRPVRTTLLILKILERKKRFFQGLTALITTNSRLVGIHYYRLAHLGRNNRFAGWNEHLRAIPCSVWIHNLTLLSRSLSDKYRGVSARFVRIALASQLKILENVKTQSIDGKMEFQSKFEKIGYVLTTYYPLFLLHYTSF